MSVTKRKCTFCKEYENPENGVTHPIGFFCSQDHAYQYSNEKQQKSREKQLKKAKSIKVASEKQDRKIHRERKKALLTRKDWIKKVRTACNGYVRERDVGKKCVTCDTILIRLGRPGGDYDAGHYRAVGNAKHLEFHTLNISGQCKKCNRFGFEKDVYTEELEKRIGVDLVAKINADQEPRKYSIPDLERLERIFKQKLKRIKS